MAWIALQQELENHPKTKELMSVMGWDLDQTIGKLSRFWWWCQKYAENGDLRKHNDNRIAEAMGVATHDAKRLVDAMVQSGWIDRSPYFRVHDWWNHIGLYLQRKYGQRDTKKWKAVKKLYNCCTTTVHNKQNKQTEQTEQNKQKDDAPKKRAVFTETLQTKINKVHQAGFNITCLINTFLKRSRLRVPIPETVLLGLCEEYLKRGDGVDDSWPYFYKVLRVRTEQECVRMNISASEEIKAMNTADQRGDTAKIEDVLANLLTKLQQPSAPEIRRAEGEVTVGK